MTTHRFVTQQFVAMLLLAAVATMSARPVHAIELIPSAGVTKSTDDNGGDAKAFGGLALRASLLPFLKAEGGIAYRQDSFADGDLKVRQWPVTASVWATPLPFFYAGGGLGWYRTTYDFDSSLPIKDSTKMQMGVHLGGGVEMPLAPKLNLDVNGRYVFMQGDNDNVQLPTSFDPDFWNVAVGLGINF